MKVCTDAVYDENYADYIGISVQSYDRIIKDKSKVCFQEVNRRFTTFYVPGTDTVDQVLDYYNFQMIPALLGLMDTSAMESSGILSVQRSPLLNLKGNGVLIGIIDTGIDYQHPAFVYEDNTTKIKAIWDQTIRTGHMPDKLEYGSEYTEDEINQALNSEDPMAIVPSVDHEGHGTFLAGLAAGRAMPVQNFTGAAPNASLCIVKLKQCKSYLRTFYGVAQDVPAYQENDVMLAMKYCVLKAQALNMPLILLLGIGSSSGGHTGDSYLCQLINDFSGTSGMAVIIAAGNEGNKRHHYSFKPEPNTDFIDVEIKSGQGEQAFSLQLWGRKPDTYTIGILSPAGEWIKKIQPATNSGQTVRLTLYQSEIFVYYQIVDVLSGDQMIFVRIRNPEPGIWTLRVYPEDEPDQPFHVWLPLDGFVGEDTYFLKPDPDTTLTETACAQDGIAVGAYNDVSDGLYIATGRGFTVSGRIKPVLTSPGVSINGPVPNGHYAVRSGTSIAAAITAGASALLMEWGIVRENDILLNNRKLERYLTMGTVRKSGLVYPNRAWGFGTLNLMNTMNELLIGILLYNRGGNI